MSIKDHILILNWNAQGPAVIRQLLQAAQSKSIVVLANRDKADLDAAVMKLGDVGGAVAGNEGSGASSRKGRGNIAQVHTRRGHPFRTEDLSLVCASDASIVILLYPEDIEDVAKAESLKAVTVAALTTLKHFQDQSLIVQVI
jgi:hypothetical protein